MGGAFSDFDSAISVLEPAAGAEVSDATREALAFFAWRIEKTVATQTSNIARMKRANAVDNSADILTNS